MDYKEADELYAKSSDISFAILKFFKDENISQEAGIIALMIAIATQVSTEEQVPVLCKQLENLAFTFAKIRGVFEEED